MDPYYLNFKAKKVGYNTPLISNARKLNNSMHIYMYNRIIDYFKSINKKINKQNFLILGITFKENCSDIRNSKVKDLVNFFLKKSISTKIYDPLILKSHLKTDLFP